MEWFLYHYAENWVCAYCYYSCRKNRFGNCCRNWDNESYRQIDAIETMAANPVKYLAVPRFLACLLMLPLLTIFADFIGILGGFLISYTKLDTNCKLC